MSVKSIKWFCGNVLALSLMLSGCGGGGGGSGDAGGQTVYSGVTTQATITEANKKLLCYDAYQAGKVASPLGSIGKAVPDVLPTAVSSPIQQVIEDAILDATLQKGTARQVAAVVTQPGTIYGPNGGSATYTITVNDTTGSFSGVMDFLDFKSSGTTLAGRSDFSGVINLATGQFTSISMKLVSLQAKDTGISVTLTGTQTKETSGTDKIITLALVVRYDTSGTTCWVKDFRFVMKQDGTMTLTGRYYDPVYGYVDISTVTPLAVSAINVEPTAGVLLFSGSNGVNGRLTFTSGSYNILVGAV
jgi:hypothetical protein